MPEIWYAHFYLWKKNSGDWIKKKQQLQDALDKYLYFRYI